MRFFLFSLGCKVNSYENSALRADFLTAGFTETSEPDKADLIVVNTCSVTGVADQKSRQHVRKFRRLSPQAILVVMGCYSELHAQEVAAMGADIVIGTAGRKEIVEAVASFQKNHEKIVRVKPSVRHETYEELGVFPYAEAARAYLKIQDGCDNYCAYCLIPTLRGNSRSREPEAVLQEAHLLVEQGYQEIVLTGIHIGMYGKDLKDGSYRLSDLMKDLLVQNKDLYRIRLGSLDESEITPNLLLLLKNYQNIANHLHIPLQSGSSSVLKRMHRHYDTEGFLKTLETLRELRPGIALTTDLIVGFPGETEEEWAETLSFLRKARFAEIHVFPFASRPGTLAATMADQVDPLTKKKRVEEALALSKEFRLAYEKTFYGQSLDVLFEDYDSEKHLAYGHTSNYLLVSYPSDHSIHGQAFPILYGPENAAD
jgi:threonylcarbamoyladenosine tRNA methylthiotransferase MtaB